MNRDIRIARNLIRIARMLLAFREDEIVKQLKHSRPDLKDDALAEHVSCILGMNPKHQKAALFWIKKKRLILPEDLSKFQDAMNLIDKQRLNFQEFEGPMEVINRDDKSTRRIKSQDIDFNPSSEKTFSHPYNAGGGVVIYDVENSKKGQLAVRKAIDANWGYDKNPWCLAARKDWFDHEAVNRLSEDEKKSLGFDSYDGLALGMAWIQWKHYSAYPKRIAFQNGKLIGLSAGDQEQYVEWWDKNDESHDEFPVDGVDDDYDFLMKYGKVNIAQNPNTPVDVLTKLAEDDDKEVRRNTARNPNTPVDVLRGLAKDKHDNVRWDVARNPNTPVDVLRKLAEDDDNEVRQSVATNPNAPSDILTMLAVDGDWYVRLKVAENPNAPADVLRTLAVDENKYVRYDAVHNPNYSE